MLPPPKLAASLTNPAPSAQPCSDLGLRGRSDAWAVSPSGMSPAQQQEQGLGPWPVQTVAKSQGPAPVLHDASFLQATF